MIEALPYPTLVPVESLTWANRGLEQGVKTGNGRGGLLICSFSAGEEVGMVGPANIRSALDVEYPSHSAHEHPIYPCNSVYLRMSFAYSSPSSPSFFLLMARPIAMRGRRPPISGSPIADG